MDKIDTAAVDGSVERWLRDYPQGVTTARMQDGLRLTKNCAGRALTRLGRAGLVLWVQFGSHETLWFSARHKKAALRRKAALEAISARKRRIVKKERAKAEKQAAAGVADEDYRPFVHVWVKAGAYPPPKTTGVRSVFELAA